MSTTCPICDVGTLNATTIVAILRYDGAELQVPNVAVSLCSACGEQMVFPDQARANDQKYSDAKREHDGLWTSARISEWRLRWGLSQQQAAQLLGGGANAFSKYERGEVIQSKPMDLLMRMYNEFPGVRESLASLAGSPSQRGWQTDKATPTLKAVLVHSTVLPKDVQRIQSTVDAYKPVREACEELAWEDSVAYGS